MSTLLNALIATLRVASDYDPPSGGAPEAVLWCGIPGDFHPLLPNLLTLGDYDPAHRQGLTVCLRAARGPAVARVSWKVVGSFRALKFSAAAS
jgi:hypothetical protein